LVKKENEMLFILRPIEVLNSEFDAWDPWYDKCFGMVVRADTKEEARELAKEEDSMNVENEYVWTSEKYTTCEELKSEGEKGLIIEDFHSA
jgi:hypothetical protein